MRPPISRRRVLPAVLAALLLLLLTGTGAFAAVPASVPATPNGDNDGTGPQFYSGLNVDVRDDVSGDVYASGQRITISGDVTGDVIAAGQSINITGNVDGNVRLAGQDVTISGEVARSGTIFASTINVTDTGVLGDDLVGAAGDIDIAGDIGRDVQVAVGDLTVDGTVGGNLTYNSSNEADIADGAVGGTIEQIVPQPQEEPTAGEKFVGWLLGLLYALVALSLITAAAGWLLPRLLHRVTDQLIPRPWKALLVGFVAFVAVPLGLLLLLATFIGAPLALAALLVWLTLMLATFVFSAYYIGRLIFRDRRHPVVMALVGGVILIVALQIPWLNVLVWFAMVFFGLGAQLLALYEKRPWRRELPVSAGFDPGPAPLGGPRYDGGQPPPPPVQPPPVQPPPPAQ
ncbi:MAG: polymer-forming cytoskeletal protein [Arthrobacter sp.]